MFLHFVNSLVTLPEPLHQALVVGLTLALAWLLAQLATVLPDAIVKWLGQYVNEAAVALAAMIVTYVNSLLAQIPASWEAVANAALMLVIEILVALGAIYQFRKARFIRMGVA